MPLKEESTGTGEMPQKHEDRSSALQYLHKRWVEECACNCSAGDVETQSLGLGATSVSSQFRRYSGQQLKKTPNILQHRKDALLTLFLDPTYSPFLWNMFTKELPEKDQWMVLKPLHIRMFKTWTALAWEWSFSSNFPVLLSGRLEHFWSSTIACKLVFPC